MNKLLKQGLIAAGLFAIGTLVGLKHQNNQKHLPRLIERPKIECPKVYDDSYFNTRDVNKKCNVEYSTIEIENLQDLDLENKILDYDAKIFAKNNRWLSYVGVKLAKLSPGAI